MLSVLSCSLLWNLCSYIYSVLFSVFLHFSSTVLFCLIPLSLLSSILCLFYCLLALLHLFLVFFSLVSVFLCLLLALAFFYCLFSFSILLMHFALLLCYLSTVLIYFPCSFYKFQLSLLIFFPLSSLKLNFLSPLLAIFEDMFFRYPFLIDTFHWLQLISINLHFCKYS